MRPYIICHMVASIDGRIDCAMVDKISGEEYYATLKKLDCPSAVEGRVTLEHYSAEKEPFVPKVYRPVGKPSVHVAVEADAYQVAVDTCGRLRWSSGEVNGMPLVCLLSEQVSEAYIERLREQGISWIVTGKERIDLPAAMETLYERFGIRRLALLGGGHINGGFLKAGLIDEVSLLLAPGIDGRKGETALFDGIEEENRPPVPLKLMSVERMDNDTLWLRYHVRANYNK